ncbi:MAG: capsule biosynthesis protein [Pseudomonadota bacterium]
MAARARLYRTRPGTPLADAPPQCETVTPCAPASPVLADASTATTHQLRLARRIARKHGLDVETDAEAVDQLQKRGIDPFNRRNLLELVAPGPSPSDAPSPAGTNTSPGGEAAASPVAPVATAHERSVEDIRQDLLRRRQRRLVVLCLRLAYWVLLPTLCVAYYFYEMATPLYATRSEFVIQQAEAQSGGFGNLFQGTGLAVQQDSATVQSYLQSREAMLRLDVDLDLRGHWSDPGIDAIRRLPEDATNEDLYRKYKRVVRIGFDPTEGLLRMEVIATDPLTAKAISEHLISYAEEQVDGLTERLRNDQMRGARDSYEDAEDRVREAQARVLRLQEQRGVLDPVAETTGQLQQIQQFETLLRQKQLERDQLLSNRSPSAAKVAGVQGDISRLEAMIARMRSALTEQTSGVASLARITSELRVAEAELATRQMLLQQAATQFETARIQADRQTRYLAIGVKPIAMDAPTYPKSLQNTIVALCVLLGIYLVVCLTESVLREQVTA